MQLTFEEMQSINNWFKTSKLKDVTMDELLRKVLKMALDKGMTRNDILNIELEVE